MQTAAHVAGHFRPFDVACARGAERVVACLGIVAPVRAGDADLELGCCVWRKRTGCASEADLKVRVGACFRSRHRREGTGYVRAADIRPVAPERLRFIRVNRVVVTELDVSEVNRRRAGIHDFDSWRNAIAGCR